MPDLALPPTDFAPVCIFCRAGIHVGCLDLVNTEYGYAACVCGVCHAEDGSDA